jgi:hypothetical protein
VQRVQTATPVPLVALRAPSVTVTGVTLRGTVDSGGIAARYTFEYGPTAKHGQSTTWIALPAARGARAVTGMLGRLTPRTTYRYALVATTAGGTVTSSEGTFETPGPPPPAPAFTLSVARGQTLESVLRHGIALDVDCTAACTADVTVVRNQRAHAAGVISPESLARGHIKLREAEARRVYLPITRIGRQLLEHATRLDLTITGMASNAAGISGKPEQRDLILR